VSDVDRSIACRTAELYVAAANSADVEAVISLFAEDGEVRHPSRGSHQGTDALRAYYSSSYARKPHLELQSLSIDGDRCIIEAIGSNATSDSSTLLVDLFTLDQTGHIRRNVVFLGPPL
jgi:hypothetical protein